MRRALVLSLALGLGACGADERAGAPSTAPPVGDGGFDAALPEAGTPIRSVELRNPFGSADPENFLVDGDFELTSSSGQFGWRAVSSTAEAAIGKETGGLCRSGVTCGVLTPAADFVGYAARPGQSDIEVALWAKPPSKDCTLTVVSLIQCTNPIVVSVADIGATSLEPDASGWCEYRAVAPAMEHRPCLLVTSFEDAETKTLLDAGSLTAAPAGKPSSIRPGPPRAEVQARAERAVRLLTERVRFGRPGPAKP